MSKTFHIFRKDIRHHWPELLVSLLLLAAFVWHEPAEWSANFPSFSLLQILFSYVNTLLPLSWCLMIVRLVHEESLVGDRQFWVTRPYEWPSLLAAKLLFLVVFIHLPVFVAQLLLLNRAGFPIAPNLTGLLGMQIGLGLLFLVPITLAVVTRSLAQAPLVAIGAFLVFSPLAPLFLWFPTRGCPRLWKTLAFLKALYSSQLRLQQSSGSSTRDAELGTRVPFFWLSERPWCWQTWANHTGP